MRATSTKTVVAAMLIAIVIGPAAMRPGLPAGAQETARKQADPAEPNTARRIKPGDLLHLAVTGTLPDQPIHGVFQVEDTGKVALGPLYGRVSFQGLTVEGAEPVLREALGKIIKSPAVQITWAIPSSALDREIALERRIQQLEKEMRALRTQIDQMRKKP